MLSVDPALGDAAQIVESKENVITVDVAGSYVELSAARAPAGEKLEVAAPQIAIGAVVDGYPLFRLLDADGDQRITRPEQRQLADLLRDLDRDGDGQLGQSEIPTAIRLAVTGGPHVHELLRERTRAARLRSRERLPVPGWFADMDRNRDGELSRREFLGTSAQFDQFDRDGNDLINDKEVQDSAPAGEPP
jgi:Ca2+-binding EF-hand superfamily protein